MLYLDLPIFLYLRADKTLLLQTKIENIQGWLLSMAAPHQHNSRAMPIIINLAAPKIGGHTQ